MENLLQLVAVFVVGTVLATASVLVLLLVTKFIVFPFCDRIGM